MRDHLGNVRVVFQENQDSRDLLNWSDYYPFGMKMPSLESEDYRYGYQGENAEEDEETGWNYFEARMYDPVIGRWLSTDPAGQYWSPYLGMGNNPVSMVDPDGAYTWLGAWIRNGFSTDGMVQSGNEWGLVRETGNMVTDVGLINGKEVTFSYTEFYHDYGDFGTNWGDQHWYFKSPNLRALYENKMALNGPIATGAIEPVYPETYLMPTAPIKGLQASRSLYASYKATRIARGLQIGKKIATKTAIKRLKQNKDVYSNTRAEAKSIMKKAKGSSTAHDKAHGRGYYNHFHNKGRTGGHSFYGSPQN